MARDWNPAQRAALDVRGRDTLVCAAAGSGKTAVLCQRILDRITDEKNPLQLSRLLIVTFTNAAAAEMRARLQKGISEALAQKPSKHLRRQAMMLNRANICTIDSCVVKDTLDESPMAYKGIEEIIFQIGPTVDIVEQIRPVYNFKASE